MSWHRCVGQHQAHRTQHLSSQQLANVSRLLLPKQLTSLPSDRFPGSHAYGSNIHQRLRSYLDDLLRMHTV